MTIVANKTLLLTGFPPDSRTGGAVIVRSLAARFAPGTLDWLSFCEPGSEVPRPHYDQFIGALPAPPAWGNTRLGLAGFWWWWKELVWDHAAVTQLRELIKKKRYRTVWMVLDHPRAGIAADLVRSCPGTKFHFSVHDHPAYSAHRENLPPSLIRRIPGHLDVLAKAACSIDAVTEEMLEDLAWDTPYRSVVTAGIDAQAAERRMRAPRAQGVLQISCIGNYIGVEAVKSAMGGLEKWSLATARPWRLSVYGRTDEELRHPCVLMHPHTDLIANRQQILDSDLFLLPMGFGDQEVAEMRTCLPTKLVSYLEFGRLIVAYAPEGSATRRIMCDHQLGPVVQDLDPASAAKAIESALCWDLDAANHGRSELLADRFASDRIFARFMGALTRSSAH
jgi:hypothetical protein